MNRPIYSHLLLTNSIPSVVCNNFEQSNHDNVSAYSVNCLCSQKDVKSYRQWMDLKRGGHRLSFISGGGSKGRS